MIMIIWNFSCHRSKSERLKTSLAIISFHFIFNITTVWRVTCGVCWEKKLHSPQISGPQTAIWQLLKSVHQIWKRVKRLLFRFWRCGGWGEVKLGSWERRLKGWDWESQWWKGGGRPADEKIKKSFGGWTKTKRRNRRWHDLQDLN